MEKVQGTRRGGGNSLEQMVKIWQKQFEKSLRLLVIIIHHLTTQWWIY